MMRTVTLTLSVAPRLQPDDTREALANDPCPVLREALEALIAQGRGREPWPTSSRAHWLDDDQFDSARTRDGRVEELAKSCRHAVPAHVEEGAESAPQPP